MSHLLVIRTEKFGRAGRKTITYRCQERTCDSSGRVSGAAEWVDSLFRDLVEGHANLESDAADRGETADGEVAGKCDGACVRRDPTEPCAECEWDKQEQAAHLESEADR